MSAANGFRTHSAPFRAWVSNAGDLLKVVEPEPIPAHMTRRAEPDVARRSIGVRLRPLVLSLSLCGGVLGLALMVRLFRWQTSDFRLYYGAAEIGARHGWASIYDLDLQRAVVSSLTPGAEWLPFLNPPPVAWLALPFTVLPYSDALVLWVVLSIIAIGASAWLLGSGNTFDRLALFAILLALFPVVWGLAAGQIVPFLMAVTVAAWRLQVRRPLLAGALFSLTFLKPQMTLLVPICLLIAGEGRFFLGWAAGTLVLATASLASVGITGAHDYLNAISLAANFQAQERWSLTTLLGTLGQPLRTVVVALAVLVALRNRKLALEPVWGAAIVASLLVTPYANAQDFSLLAVAAAIWLQTATGQWRWWFIGLGLLAMEFSQAIEPPIIAVEAGWLGILAVTSRRVASPLSA